MSVRGEEGFTLAELLAAMAIFLVLMLATLNTLDIFTAQTSLTNRRNETQNQARAVVRSMARQLRNLASPTPGRPQAVDKATAYDLVFQSVDPQGPNAGPNSANVRRVRYCLSTVDPGNGTLWQQTQTWTQAATPDVPATGSCPGSDARWATTGIVATNVVNAIGGQQRPVWLYNATATSEISFLRVTLIVDLKPGSNLGESTLSTGVFLRNQNRVPVAAFTATPTGSRHVLLNGSLSLDPEGEPLSYAWYDGETAIGTGITIDYTAPVAGTRALSLTVTDPGDLESDAPVQQVVVQ